MGKYFAPILTESGRKATIWFDSAPEAGDQVTCYFHDEIGVLQNSTETFVRFLTDSEAKYA